MSSLISAKLKEQGIRKAWLADYLDVDYMYLNNCLNGKGSNRKPSLLEKLFLAVTDDLVLINLRIEHGTVYLTHLQEHKNVVRKSSKVHCPACRKLYMKEYNKHHALISKNVSSNGIG